MSASFQPVASPAVCGETITPGMSHSGDAAGSGSLVKTSGAAPASRPVNLLQLGLLPGVMWGNRGGPGIE